MGQLFTDLDTGQSAELYMEKRSLDAYSDPNVHCSSFLHGIAAKSLRFLYVPSPAAAHVRASHYAVK